MDILDDSRRAGRLSPGAAFGRYELLSPLASGRVTSVWLARLTGEHGFEKRFALKILRRRSAEAPAAAAALMREASLGARLYHPHIVHVVDCGRVGRRCYLAMEHVPGVTLAAALDRFRALGASRCARLVAHVALQICRALDYAHRVGDGAGPLGFVHGAVTPDNVMVTRSGAVKLLDFGSSYLSREVHTPPPSDIDAVYVAPERVRGFAGDHRTDLYAVGVLLYEGCTGGSGAQHAIPEPLEQIARRATAIHPDYRPASAATMAAALDGFLAKESRRARSAGEDPEALLRRVLPASAPSGVPDDAEGTADDLAILDRLDALSPSAGELGVSGGSVPR
jgi:serine/threonine-protein kinase